MDETTLSMLGRVVERLMVVIAGIILIVLGYHLYLNGVGGDAKIMFEMTGQKYQLENATPGIIFALLGVIVIGHSIVSPLKIKTTTASDIANIGRATTVVDSDSSVPSAGKLKELRISYSDTTAASSGLQLQLEDIHQLYRAVFVVVADKSIDTEMRNALADAYRSIYEKNKLGPDGAARLRKLQQMREEELSPDQLKELETLKQKISSEYSPEKFGGA